MKPRIVLCASQNERWIALSVSYCRRGRNSRDDDHDDGRHDAEQHSEHPDRHALMLGVRVRKRGIRNVEQPAVPVNLVDEVEDALVQVSSCLLDQCPEIELRDLGGAIPVTENRNTALSESVSGLRTYSHP